MMEMARLLDEAARQGRLLDGLPLDLSIEEAYDVQRATLAMREGRGERLVGWKMGLTSRAKMRQMNVHQPIYGYLTDRMLASDGDVLSLERLRQPRVEPEICFLMGADVVGPVSCGQAMAAVRGVCAALEVLDSRYKDFKFNLPNVVADNGSAAFVVLGSALVPPPDLQNLGIVLECDGRVVETASSAAIYDHPARALATLVNMIAPRVLRAGDIVMAGAATQAVSVKPDPSEGRESPAVRLVRACVDRIGTCSLRLAP